MKFRITPASLTLVLSAIGLTLGVAACRYDMQDQPKYLAYRGSETFADSLSSRPYVEGTVARGNLRDDEEFYTGMPAGGATAATKAPGDTTGGASGAATATGSATFPYPITKEILDRGQERFNIYCSPCHGMLGDGRGMIVLRGFRQPPSFHQDRLRNVGPGYIFNVITKGFGVMPDYAMQVPPHERWAIAAYIKALQLSQNATVADVPPAELAKLK